MKEIEIKDFVKFVNPFDIEREPAIAIASDGERTNGLTIGWAQYGVLWNRLSATVYVHRKRYSKEIFDKAAYFSVCYLADGHDELIKYFGTVSGRDEDKMANSALTVVRDDVAPYFAESRVVVLCRIMGKSDFDASSVDEKVKAWYQRDGVHTLYYGEIVKVLVEG